MLSLNWTDKEHYSFYSSVDHQHGSEEKLCLKADLNGEETIFDMDSFEKQDETKDFKSPIEMFTDSRLTTTKDRSKDRGRIAEWERHYDCFQDEECACKKKQKSKAAKKVSFADDSGKELTEVKIATESMNTPPCLSKKALKNIEESLFETSSHLPAPWVHKPFHLTLSNFNPPHLDLLGLDRRVEEKGLALSSIYFEAPFYLKGNIETRSNIPFDVKAVIRYTLDEWKSWKDLDCVCLSSSRDFSHHFYSFEIDISPNHNSVTFEFAINLKTPGLDLWDNNESMNYKVFLSSDPPSSPQLPSLSRLSPLPEHLIYHPQQDNSFFFPDEFQFCDTNPQSNW